MAEGKRSTLQAIRFLVLSRPRLLHRGALPRLARGSRSAGPLTAELGSPKPAFERETHAEYAPLRTSQAAQSAPREYCPNCTPQGCTLPADDRPIQCLAYHCRASIAPLSAQECESGIRAVKDLMRVMIETAALPQTATRS